MTKKFQIISDSVLDSGSYLALKKIKGAILGHFEANEQPHNCVISKLQTTACFGTLDY